MKIKMLVLFCPQQELTFPVNYEILSWSFFASAFKIFYDENIHTWKNRFHLYF